MSAKIFLCGNGVPIVETRAGEYTLNACAAGIGRRSDKQKIAEAFHLGNVDGVALEFAPDYNASTTVSAAGHRVGQAVRSAVPAYDVLALLTTLMSPTRRNSDSTRSMPAAKA